MTNIDKTTLFALSNIKGVGPKAIEKILDSGMEIHELRNLEPEKLGEYIRGGKNKEEAIEQLVDNFDQCIDRAEYQLNNYSDDNIVVLSRYDDNFPELYKLIPDPPLFIYVKGNIELLDNKKNIAIVGTRECTETGHTIAFSTAKYFAKADFNIVSGLALGIDTAAHEGALSVSGKTTSIVVDIENIFPEENKGLAEDIINNDGLLISENKPGTIQHRGLFVSRDRLQSGLSLGVFPIETDVIGGTMHTVQFSIDQKRLLFCPDFKKVPDYNLSAKQCQGVLKLIDENKAESYSRDDYDKIIEQLNKKQIDLLTKNKLPPTGQNLRLDGF